MKWRGSGGGWTGKVLQSYEAAERWFRPKMVTGAEVVVETREVPEWRRVTFDEDGNLAGVEPVCPPAVRVPGAPGVVASAEPELEGAVAEDVAAPWFVEWGDNSSGFMSERSTRVAARLLRDKQPAQELTVSQWDDGWTDYRPVRNLEAWLDGAEAVV